MGAALRSFFLRVIFNIKPSCRLCLSLVEGVNSMSVWVICFRQLLPTHVKGGFAISSYKYRRLAMGQQPQWTGQEG